MTLFAYLNGSDVGLNIRLNGFGLTTRADGSVGVGGIIFDDPTGTLNVRGWMTVLIKETACVTAPVLFDGFIFDRTYSRNTARVGAGRFIDTNLLDQNAVMHVRLITGLDGKRPAETRADRLQWILESPYLGNLIDDTSLVTWGEENFEEASYLGQYADDVLADISAPINRIFFVYSTQPDGGRGLFFDRATEEIATSTLTISNVLTDVSFDANGLVTGTCYPPHVDATLERDPSEVYSNIRYTYKNGTILGHNDDTADEFFTDNGLGSRGLQVDNTRVGQESTARTFGARILARDSQEADTITVTIQLPPDKVGLVQAGDRIQVRFTHLEGYDPAAFSRVTARQVKQADDNDQLYDVTLTLNTYGLSGGGGGGAPGPGVFPNPTPSATIVQQSAGVSDRPFANPITAGNTLVYIAGRRAGVPATPTGYTIGPDGAATDGASDSVIVFYKLADGSENQTLIVGELNQAGVWYELAGEWTPDAHDEDIGTGETMSTGPITAAPTSFVFVIGGLGNGGGFDAGGFTMTDAAGFTTDFSSKVFDGHPWVYAAHMLSTEGGSISASTTLSTVDAWNWAMQIVSFTASDFGSSPPEPGQWVYNETPTEAPGGGGFTFFTVNPFTDGSLQVFVDLVDQTAALTSYDGACGVFTLAFNPRSWETVLVNYQGI